MKDVARKLGILAGVCSRSVKDISFYEKELSTQETKITAMRHDPTKDSHDINKQLEVLAETESQLPDCRARLAKAVEDVKAFMDEHGGMQGIRDTAEWAKATDALAAAANIAK